MKMMVRLTIDGKKIEVEEGLTILEAAQEAGIDIPTLCYHEALTPYGVCRLCTVEVIKGKRKMLVTSCNYPAEEGIEVETNSEEVKNVRKMIVELLLARCPKVESIQNLAREYGIERARFKLEDEDCILCGLCVRACEEVVGAKAISFVGRGVERQVDTPFHIASEACLGCGACAYICPTGAIKMEDIEGVRKIERLSASHPLKKCKVCGNYFAPQVQIDYIVKKLGLPKDAFEFCLTCREESSVV